MLQWLYTSVMQVHTVVRTLALGYRTNSHRKRGYLKIIDHKKWISEKQEVEEADT
jgi:hypothetical protein